MSGIEARKSVIRYNVLTNNKGEKYLKPIYLNETPIEEIKRLNEMFTLHKGVKQD